MKMLKLCCQRYVRPELFVILRTQTSVLMRYTYRFTQISREENGNLVPVSDKPYEFIFTFGKKIEYILDENSDNTVLLTKDLWKEYPANNKEILHTVCFSTPSKQGFRRPLVMTKDADHRAGEYRYQLVYNNEIKDGMFLSEDIKQLTGIFVNGVKAVNNKELPITWQSLADANVEYLMSYIKSYVYSQLLQDKDKKGKVRSEAFLKEVLKKIFILIPDTVIDEFDKGLIAHDEIRAKLEGVPEDAIATRKAILKSQGFFNSIDDYNLFVALRKYILSIKNGFNHLVWVMYRSKIGLVSLKIVKGQLGAIFGFSFKVQDNSNPKNKAEILEEICRIKKRHKAVKEFLDKIEKLCCVKDLNKSYQAALCYKFQEECHWKYLSSRYRYVDAIHEKDKYKPIHQEEFRDLCLRYWGIEEPNTMKPNKCKKIKEKTEKKFNMYPCDTEIWEKIKKEPQD